MSAHGWDAPTKFCCMNPELIAQSMEESRQRRVFLSLPKLFLS